MPILQQCNPTSREWSHTGESAFGISRAKLATGLKTSNNAKKQKGRSITYTFFVCMWLAASVLGAKDFAFSELPSKRLKRALKNTDPDPTRAHLDRFGHCGPW